MPTASNSFIRNPEILLKQFMGINNLPSIRPSAADEEYLIDTAYDQRPDLLAHNIYGEPRLWWVFFLRNPDSLRDPLRDFSAGKTIILPSQQAVRRITQQG